ncbi:hypothetical protein CBS101457_002778 [Exobasidium rhododendri]|nr:hypothetical protein CBS101457_002778 [Exobasidium rhododendri]
MPATSTLQRSRTRCKKAKKRLVDTDAATTSTDDLPEQHIYHPVVFRQELEATGLTADSTAHEIDQKTHNLLKKYPALPHPTKALKIYLRGIGVPESVIQFFYATRRKIAQAMNKQNSRQYHRMGVESLERARFFDTEHGAWRENISKGIEHFQESQRLAHHVQLQDFYHRLLHNHIHYGLDAFSYALKEIPFRQTWGASSYCQYQSKLQRALKIDKEWIREYRVANRSITIQKQSYARSRGGAELPIKLIRRPSWAKPIDLNTVEAVQDVEDETRERAPSPPPQRTLGQNKMKMVLTEVKSWAITKKRSGLVAPKDGVGSSR